MNRKIKYAITAVVALSSVAVLIFMATTPPQAGATIVKNYGGAEPQMTFYSPTHGQKFSPGQNILVSGSETVPFCGPQYGVPFGCRSRTLFVDNNVIGCSVAYYLTPSMTSDEEKNSVYDFTKYGIEISAHSGSYKANLVRNANSATCNFDKLVPIPSNIPEGNYVVWTYTIWETPEHLNDFNIGALGEHITICNGCSSPEKPALFFNADSQYLQSGQSTMLRWTSMNVNSCSAAGGWSGAKGTSGTESTGNLSAKTTFTLSCTGSAGSVTRSVVVDAWSPPPVIDIKANGSDSPSAIPQNTAATLSWSSQYANSCTASGGWSGAKPMSGSESTGNLVSARTFTITCANNAASRSDSVTVPIQKSNLTSSIFNVSGALMAGTATTLSGSVTNSSPVNITATFQNRFEIDRDQNSVVDDSVSASITAINANQNKPASASWTPTQAATAYRIRLCADTPGNVINESNEGDNCSTWSASFTVQPKPAPPPLPCGGAVCTYGCNATTNVCNPPPVVQKPDLIIFSSPVMRDPVTLQQLSSADAGKQVYFTFAAKNNGTAATPSGFSNQVFIDLGNNGSVDVALSPNPQVASSLGTGAIRSLASGIWTAQAGTHRVTVCADYPLPGGVSESNENNNCSGQGISANDIIITIAPPLSQCSNGFDDDGDGNIDLADPGCANPSDNDETDPPPPLPNSNFTLSASPVLLTTTVVGGSSALATSSATFVTITPQAGFTPGSNVTLIFDKSASHAVAQNLVSRFIQSGAIIPEVTITVGSAPQSVVFRLGVPHDTALGAYEPIVIRAKDTDKTANVTLRVEEPGGTGER